MVSHSFQELMKQVQRKTDVNAQDAKYAIFDVLPLSEFKDGVSKLGCEKRHKDLEVLGRIISGYDKSIFVVEKEKVKLTHKERIEFDNLEKDIATLEDRKNKLSEQLNKGDLPYSEIEKISNELTETVTTIDTKSERWMELAEFVN